MNHVYKVTVEGAQTNHVDRVVRYFADDDASTGKVKAHTFADSRRSDSGTIGVRVQRLTVR